ncbi:MAG: hypothetical protein ACOYXA_15825 [Bacteroidota bacterium]
MAKTILVPTDLTIESLNILSYAIRHEDNGPLDIVLLNGYRSSDSIIDLLFFNKENERDTLVSKEFKEAYEILKNRNASKVNSIAVEFFSGFNKAAMRNLLEARAVEKIYLPATYKMRELHARSFDITPLLRGQQLPFTEVNWSSQAHTPEKNLSAEIFLYESK